MMKVMKKILIASAAVVTAGSSAYAETTGGAAYDLTSLVSAVDFSQVVTAVLGIAASLMAVYVVMRGIKFIYSAVRG